MNTRNRQLPLCLSQCDGDRFGNFFIGDNQLLLNLLRDTAETGRESQISLWGAGGCGKTHLLQAACHAASLQGRTAAYLPMRDMAHRSPDMLQGMAQINCIVVDDIEIVSRSDHWQYALFALINQARQQGASIICASRNNPGELNLLPDLVSRLLWGPVLRVQKPGDHQLAAAVRSRATMMGLEVSDDVINYLLSRHSRELGRLYAGLAELDRVSLAAQRRLTVPFVRAVLGLDQPR